MYVTVEPSFHTLRPFPSHLAYTGSWGPSAGGFSVGAHLVANGGDNEGLFRAAVLSCGSLLPTGDMSTLQPSFDGVVAHAGCTAAEDKLQCLRGLPVENFTAAGASVTSFFGDGVGIYLAVLTSMCTESAN